MAESELIIYVMWWYFRIDVFQLKIKNLGQSQLSYG